MRTLLQCLKAHTGCKHKVSGAFPRLRHGNVWWAAPPIIVQLHVAVQSLKGSGTDVEDFEKNLMRAHASTGSAAFHEAARWLMSLPGHERHQMHITDEEYAGFVGGSGG